MILEVLTYPNPRLFERGLEVTEFDAELGEFLDNMYETMIAKNGIGLAALQVGRKIRAFIVNLSDEEGKQDKANLIEVINPKFLKFEGELIYQEGCLSVPGYFDDVKRAEKIVLEYQNRFGEKQILEADGLLAVALQHENDHLDGHLFIEKIGFTKKKKFDKEFSKTHKIPQSDSPRKESKNGKKGKK